METLDVKGIKELLANEQKVLTVMLDLSDGREHPGTLATRNNIKCYEQALIKKEMRSVNKPLYTLDEALTYGGGLFTRSKRKYTFHTRFYIIVSILLCFMILGLFALVAKYGPVLVDKLWEFVGSLTTSAYWKAVFSNGELLGS